MAKNPNYTQKSTDKETIDRGIYRNQVDEIQGKYDRSQSRLGKATLAGTLIGGLAVLYSLFSPGFHMDSLRKNPEVSRYEQMDSSLKALNQKREIIGHELQDMPYETEKTKPYVEEFNQNIGSSVASLDSIIETVKKDIKEIKAKNPEVRELEQLESGNQPKSSFFLMISGLSAIAGSISLGMRYSTKLRRKETRELKKAFNDHYGHSE